MKRAIFLLACCFAIGFGAVLASRLDSGAIAVVAGVLAGVLASIPTALLLVWALGKRSEPSPVEHTPQQSYPPVIVVGGQQLPWPWPGQNSQPAQLPAPGQRQYRLIGEEYADEELS